MDQFSKKILAASIVLAFGFAGNVWAAEGAGSALPSVTDAAGAGKGQSNAAASGGSTSTTADSSNSSNTNSSTNDSNNSKTVDARAC
ncbi:MAG TPA: hypothetical protein DDW43_02445 [Nitrosomonas sp.]|uniref:hypothetical protein n=1 Tax=Nitrosomonas sp. TaxID=42353 RepID=UPI000E9D8B62|nr:hypothetical protein [Nitrosomonas sp.]HBF24357.1 hypothetical protein [Nitrosomonas sp.]